ncbi:mercuric transport protein MerTP [Pedobacter nototheniae]|uniref:mercuric transport protein MerTP n=1 Tax=Pedobacter nototheniae TaxID=2488994 RepID=UPI00103F3F69|nr:mercuric transport protein MerTP [Pedobacter nototheniae]
MSIGSPKSWIAGLFAAFTASLCCIAPLFAVIGGAGSASTYFGWIEPYRPYIIGLTILVFALAWYKLLKAGDVQKDNCGCEVQQKSFMGSKKFLIVVTVISALLITFPYYSSLLYASPKTAPTTRTVRKKLANVKFSIAGMSCEGCTSHIDGGLNGISGIASSTTSFEQRMALVSYDPDSITADSISKKIRKIGYRNTIITKN